MSNICGSAVNKIEQIVKSLFGEQFENYFKPKVSLNGINTFSIQETFQIGRRRIGCIELCERRVMRKSLLMEQN